MTKAVIILENKLFERFYSDKETGLQERGSECPEVAHCVQPKSTLCSIHRNLHLHFTYCTLGTPLSHLHAKSQSSMGRNSPILQRRKLGNLLCFLLSVGRSH